MEQGGHRQVGKHSVGGRTEEAGLTSRENAEKPQHIHATHML